MVLPPKHAQEHVVVVVREDAPSPPPPPVKDAAASQPREASLGHEASLSYPQGLANLTAASAALHLKLVFRFGCITNAVP